MKIAALLVLVMGLIGCSSIDSNRPIVRFHREALKRSRHHHQMPSANADGLLVRVGWLPGGKRYPGGDEDSIVVSDPDPNEEEAVLIIVNPRVSGSFLDPEHPSAEFLKELEDNARYALENSRYLVVQLLPKR